MGFLIRCAFWLSLVLLIIPIHTSDATRDQPTVGAIQAFFAAREAFQDLGGICERKPDVCATGRAALHTITVRARATANYALALIDEDEKAPDTSITTGTVPPLPVGRPDIEADKVPANTN